MTSATGDGAGVKPSLSADDLLESVPGLAAAADVTAHTLVTIPGASLTFAEVLEALAWARSAVDGGHDGVVVVQGTDTIEETSYLLDLHWDRPAPLVVTGAMRSAHAAGADGPANLLAAVQVAGSPDSRDRGVLVVMNDEIHAASRVRKMRSSGLDAFCSPGFGPVGYLEESLAMFGGEFRRAEPLPLPATPVQRRVALLETYLGDDGALLDLVVAAGYDGVVVQAFGVGHVAETVAGAISRATSSVPVVMTSRTGAGTTFAKTYGFPGSESDLLARGIIPAGWLDGRKARILLDRLLAASWSTESIAAEFRLRGQLISSVRTLQ